MTSTATILGIWAACTAAGAAVAQATTTGDSITQLVTGGGAAGVIAGLCLLLFKRMDESHRACTATFADAVKDGHEKFSATVRDQSEKFGETTTILLREARAECASREDKLIEVLKGQRPSS